MITLPENWKDGIYFRKYPCSNQYGLLGMLTLALINNDMQTWTFEQCVVVPPSKVYNNKERILKEMIKSKEAFDATLYFVPIAASEQETAHSSHNQGCLTIQCRTTKITNDSWQVLLQPDLAKVNNGIY